MNGIETCWLRRKTFLLPIESEAINHKLRDDFNILQVMCLTFRAASKILRTYAIKQVRFMKRANMCWCLLFVMINSEADVAGSHQISKLAVQSSRQKRRRNDLNIYRQVGRMDDRLQSDLYWFSSGMAFMKVETGIFMDGEGCDRLFDILIPFIGSTPITQRCNLVNIQ